MGKYTLNLSEKAKKDLMAIHNQEIKVAFRRLRKFSMNFLKHLLKESANLNC